MIRSGISLVKSSNEQKPREPPVNGKQKGKFAGKAKKKNRRDKVAKRSLVHVEAKEEVSDSDDDNQQEFGYVATVVKTENM